MEVLAKTTPNFITIPYEASSKYSATINSKWRILRCFSNIDKANKMVEQILKENAKNIQYPLENK